MITTLRNRPNVPSFKFLGNKFEMQSHRCFLVTKCLGQVCVWSAICSKIHYAKLKQLIPAKPRPGGFKLASRKRVGGRVGTSCYHTSC